MLTTANGVDQKPMQIYFLNEIHFLFYLQEIERIPVNVRQLDEEIQNAEFTVDNVFRFCSIEFSQDFAQKVFPSVT